MQALVWQLEGVDEEIVRGEWSRACVSQDFRGTGPLGPDCSIWALALYELCLNDGSVPGASKAHTSVRIRECCTRSDLCAVMATVRGGEKDRKATCDIIWSSGTLVARAVNISDLTRAQLDRHYVCIEAGYVNAGLVDFATASYSCNPGWHVLELRSDITPMGGVNIGYNRPRGTEGWNANEVFHLMAIRKGDIITSKQATYGFHWSHMYGPSSDGAYHCYPHVGHPGQWSLVHTTKIATEQNRASVVDGTSSGWVLWRPYFVSPERRGEANVDMGLWSGTRRPLATVEHLEGSGELVFAKSLSWYVTSGTCVGEGTDACVLGIHGFDVVGEPVSTETRLVVGGGGPLTEQKEVFPEGDHKVVFSWVGTTSWILDALSLPYCLGLLYILIVGHVDGSLSFAGYATIIGEVFVEVASRLLMCAEARRSDGSNSGPYSVVSAAIAPIAWSLSDFAEVSEARKWVRRSPMRLEALSAIITMGAVGTVIEDGRGGALATFLVTGAGLLVGAVGAKADIVLEAVGSRQPYIVTRVMVGYACLYFSGMVLQAYIILLEGVSFVSSMARCSGCARALSPHTPRSPS